MRVKYIDHCNQMSGRKLTFELIMSLLSTSHICVHTHTHTHTHTTYTAFMGEFHKMAGVINGLATTFAMENEDCEYNTYNIPLIRMCTNSGRIAVVT